MYREDLASGVVARKLGFREHPSARSDADFALWVLERGDWRPGSS